jgi:hypothetical protein
MLGGYFPGRLISQLSDQYIMVRWRWRAEKDTSYLLARPDGKLIDGLAQSRLRRKATNLWCGELLSRRKISLEFYALARIVSQLLTEIACTSIRLAIYY